MDRLQMIQWVASISGLFFTFCFGAIVGSFLNVVVYRLPKGLNLVRPPSACPACETRLPWKYNFPIFGWLRLRGRCAFCKTKISPEYPLVEALVALLFSATYVLWFMRPSLLGLVGVDPFAWTPAWAMGGVLPAWPHWLLLLVMISVLVAVTLIDAKTFLIPLELPWLIGGLGLIVHPAHALWLDMSGRLHRIQNDLHAWTIPLADGPVLGAALLAGVGIVASALLLWKGWMPRSFADYEAWEQQAREEAHRARTDPEAPPPDTGVASASSGVLRALFLAGPGIAGLFFGMSLGFTPASQTSTSSGPWLTYGLIGLVLGLGVGLVLRRIVPVGEERHDAPIAVSDDDDPDDLLWTMYPHARREMVKEVLFLLPAMVLGALGWWLCAPGGALGDWASTAPLPIRAFGGAVLGLLIGGGLVWGVRILGSIAFNKEAMGLGDVHLMAGVGAVLGWIDPTLAFFLAPFTGILWVVLSSVSKALFNRAGAHLPYGPQLALMTVAVVLFKPWAELGLTALMGDTIDLP